MFLRRFLSPFSHLHILFGKAAKDCRVCTGRSCPLVIKHGLSKHPSSAVPRHAERVTLSLLSSKLSPKAEGRTHKAEERQSWQSECVMEKPGGQGKVWVVGNPAPLPSRDRERSGRGRAGKYGCRDKVRGALGNPCQKAGRGDTGQPSLRVPQHPSAQRDTESSTSPAAQHHPT